MSSKSYLFRFLAIAAISGILSIPYEVFRWIFVRADGERLTVSPLEQ